MNIMFYSIIYLLSIFSFAQASIYAHPDSAEELEKLKRTTHENALEHVGSCCEVVGSVVNPKTPFWVASGCLIHQDADHKRFFVLTSAHDLFDEKFALERHSGIRLDFAPTVKLLSGSKNSYQATAVYPHPGFRENAKGASECDIALIEFETVEPCHTLKPLALYNGTGFTKPLLKAQIVGYGQFGTNQECVRKTEFNIRCGFTKVTHMKWRDHEGFRCWLRANKDNAYFAKNPEHIARFSVNPADKMRLDYGDTKIFVDPHEDQAMIAAGGSGSPLLFQTKEGCKVAGVASRTSVEVIDLETRDDNRPLLVQVFEPVMPHLPWIKKIVEDKIVPAGTNVIKLMPKKAPASF